MGWSYLAVAVVLEIGWASSLKWTDGYTRLVPSLINFSLSVANVFFLAQATKFLPTALTYFVWTGVGSVGIAIFAYWFQGESFGLVKIVCVSMILLGAAGLKAFSPN